MPITQFVKRDVDNVREFWVCKNEDCKKVGKVGFYVHPNWYENNGTPVCAKCDCDMGFHHVEVSE